SNTTLKKNCKIMKTSFVTRLVLSFLALSTNQILGRSDPLLDVNGDEVQATLDYYVVSAIRGAGGGGLTLFPGRNEICPLDVVQESFYMQRGTPIRFATYNNTSIIHEAMDLNVKFSTVTRCNEATVWKVGDYDEKTGEWFITTGGVEGNPGAETLMSWFKFEKPGSLVGAYRIVHCPSVCDSCMSMCKIVGRTSVDGARRLVLGAEDPLFLVVLVPANEGSMSV
ncbi:Trypsin inhibitor, partial [Melia azedarach]